MPRTTRNQGAEEGGFRRVMRGLDESQSRRMVESQQDERQQLVNKLYERFSKTRGLGFEDGKLDEMMNKDAKKTANMLLYLAETEKSAMSNRELVSNYETQRSIRESIGSRGGRLREDTTTQTSSFLGITPQDIVKVMRIAYPNSVAPEIFDFWGMSSMKDTLYKLETTYGTTHRGETAGNVVYESYADGRYPSEVESDTVNVSGGPTTTFSGTLASVPVRPFTIRIYLNGEQVGIDNGAGVFVGPAQGGSVANALTGTNTINYTSGAYTVTFTSNVATTDTLIIQSDYNSEISSLFSNVGNVLLNLVAYDYRAVPWPMAIEWTRFTEELMQSKLNLSAKEMLLAGTADVFRANVDQYCITRGVQASKWTSAVSFDTDFASAGSDSSIAHAQSVLQAVINAELKTYGALGRYADKTSLVVDSYAVAYLTKHKLYNSIKPASRVGVHKVGELDGRDIYLAPYGLLTDVRSSNQGQIFCFGKGNDQMNVDAVVSVGTWKAGLTTNPVELKNFNSQMGLAMYADIRTNNRQFAVPITLTNLTPNS